MKKIDNKQMLSINGGAKCIYHAMLAAATIGMGPISWGLNYYFGNYTSVSECWDNAH